MNKGKNSNVSEQRYLKLLTKEHRFLISLQNRHALQVTHRIILRAVSIQSDAVSNVAIVIVIFIS